MLNLFAQNLLKTSHVFPVFLPLKQDLNLFCRLLSTITNSSLINSPDQIHPASRQEEIKVEETPKPIPQTKVLKFAIVGNPNVGKSTLINKIMNRRVFACSSKTHTTRRQARAVFNHGDTQLVFLDTPGLVTATESKRFHLAQSFTKDGENALQEANIIGVLHDVSIRHVMNRLDPKVLRLLHLFPKKHFILILNKIDLLKSKDKLLDYIRLLTNNKAGEGPPDDEEFERISEVKLKKIVEKERGWPYFREVFMISALSGDGVDDLRDYLLYHAKPRQWLFPADVFTDQDPVNIIKESVRSRFLDSLSNEVPYNLKIDMEYLDTTAEGTIVAVLLVTCDKKRIEKYVMGAGGGKIRQIARQAEQELANTFLTVVKLKLVVRSKDSDDSDTVNC